MGFKLRLFLASEIFGCVLFYSVRLVIDVNRFVMLSWSVRLQHYPVHSCPDEKSLDYPWHDEVENIRTWACGIISDTRTAAFWCYCPNGVDCRMPSAADR